MAEFEEIAHSGGKVRIKLDIAADGKRNIQLSYIHGRPVPVSLIGVYAIPPDVPVGDCDIFQLSDPNNLAPIYGAKPVFIASDSEGKYGRNCPACGKYWRSERITLCCPYCGASGQNFQFTSNTQRSYIKRYLKEWEHIERSEVNAEYEFDFDEIAEATLSRTEKPDFYFADERQQTSFHCDACGSFNDILGKYGHCSACFTRNDRQLFESTNLVSIRKRLRDGVQPEKCLRDTVAALESVARQYCESLVAFVPMTPERRNLASTKNYRNMDKLGEIFSVVFGVDLKKDFSEADWQYLNMLVYRRHVYEHNDGTVDELYLKQSGDDSVRLGQLISETADSVEFFMEASAKIVRRIHRGYHQILPPIDSVIQHFKHRSE